MANPCHSPDIESAQFCVGISLARALYVSEINGLGYAAALFSWVSRKTTRHGDTESDSHNATTAQSVRRFRDSCGPESTVAALLTDSAIRGFAISFSTSRKVVFQDFFFLLGIRPSCHASKAKNGQFRPEE